MMCCYLILVLTSYLGGSLLMVLFILFIYMYLLLFTYLFFSKNVSSYNWFSSEKLNSYSYLPSWTVLELFTNLIKGVITKYDFKGAQ